MYASRFDRPSAGNMRDKIQIKHQGTREKQTILDQVKPTSANHSTARLLSGHFTKNSKSANEWQIISLNLLLVFLFLLVGQV